MTEKEHFRSRKYSLRKVRREGSGDDNETQMHGESEGVVQKNKVKGKV